MKNLFIVLLLILTLVSCKKQSKNEPSPQPLKAENNAAHVDDSTVLIPDFLVKLQLDPALYQQLKSSNESVVAGYYFYKTLDDSTKIKPELQPHMDGNQLELLTGQVEESKVSQPEITFRFKGLALPKALDDAAGNKVLHLNINFFSGRKAFEDNMMDAELLDLPFEKVLHASQPFTLKAKLLKR